MHLGSLLRLRDSEFVCFRCVSSGNKDWNLFTGFYREGLWGVTCEEINEEDLSREKNWTAGQPQHDLGQSDLCSRAQNTLEHPSKRQRNVCSQDLPGKGFGREHSAGNIPSAGGANLRPGRSGRNSLLGPSKPGHTCQHEDPSEGKWCPVTRHPRKRLIWGRLVAAFKGDVLVEGLLFITTWPVWTCTWDITKRHRYLLRGVTRVCAVWFWFQQSDTIILVQEICCCTTIMWLKESRCWWQHRGIASCLSPGATGARGRWLSPALRTHVTTGASPAGPVSLLYKEGSTNSTVL